MINSELLHAIMRGSWFISVAEADNAALLISKILDRDSSVFSHEIFSENHPLKYMISASSKNDDAGNSFAAAPEDSVALIELRGTMTKNGTLCNYGTAETAAAIRAAADAENISGILLCIDSGGGTVDAIAPITSALEYLRSCGKSSVAYVDLCCSAAYYAAIYCDEIIASNSISAEVGSIGVMMSFMDYAKYYEDKGIKEVRLYSSLSTYKNAPYEAAKKGEYNLIKSEMLDPLALNFQEAVKKRRPSLNIEEKGILNGRTFFAEKAKEVGLIDGITTQSAAIARVRAIHNDMCVTKYINSKK